MLTLISTQSAIKTKAGLVGRVCIRELTSVLLTTISAMCHVGIIKKFVFCKVDYIQTSGIR